MYYRVSNPTMATNNIEDYRLGRKSSTLETGYKNTFYPREKWSYIRFILICDSVDKLHDLALGKSCLISGLFLYPVFLYPVFLYPVSSIVVVVVPLTNGFSVTRRGCWRRPPSGTCWAPRTSPRSSPSARLSVRSCRTRSMRPPTRGASR